MGTRIDDPRVYRAWQFRAYFIACAIYTVICTVLMVHMPQLGAWFCWPPLALLVACDILGCGIGGLGFRWLDGHLAAGMFMVVSLYSLVLFLPMALNVIRPREYWMPLQMYLVMAHPIVGLLLLLILHWVH